MARSFLIRQLLNTTGSETGGYVYSTVPRHLPAKKDPPRGTLRSLRNFVPKGKPFHPCTQRDINHMIDKSLGDKSPWVMDGLPNTEKIF